MSNSAILLGEALGMADDVHRKQFVGDSGMAVVVAFTLMSVQVKWMTQLQMTRIDFIMQSLNPDPSGAALAKALQIKYDNDSTTRDIQTNATQSTLQSVQGQIDQDNKNRQAVFESVTSTKNALMYLTKLLAK